MPELDPELCGIRAQALVRSAIAVVALTLIPLDVLAYDGELGANAGGPPYIDAIAVRLGAGVGAEGFTVTVASVQFAVSFALVSPAGRVEGADCASGRSARAWVPSPRAGVWHVVVSSPEGDGRGSYSVTFEPALAAAPTLDREFRMTSSIRAALFSQRAATAPPDEAARETSDDAVPTFP